MHRIAIAALIAAAALVVDGDLGRPAFAEGPAVAAPAPAATLQPVASRTGKVLTLLMILEALRQSPAVLAAPKL